MTSSAHLRCILNSRQMACMFTLVSCLACSASESPDRDRGNASATGGAGSNDGTGGQSVLLDSGDGDGTPPGHCRGLQCQQTTCTTGNCSEAPCTDGALTTVKGTVYDPAGKVPLYNVMVYVPNSPPPPFTPGVSCDRCGSIVENPVVSALTDERGNFVLEDVPVGTNIPLVIQVGKWRRQIEIASVPRCVETPLTDINQTRLPKSTKEGDIPLIAITTGYADSIECLPLRMGIELSEFTTSTGTGRIHLFAGMQDGPSEYPAPNFASTHLGGAALTKATELWSNLALLKKYDVVILGCEGGTVANGKPMDWRANLYEYASVGGRVLATHWHHIWFSGGPAPVPETGTWLDRSNPPESIVGTINQSFPKGQSLAKWLVNVGSPDPEGQVTIIGARDNIQAVNPDSATSWITIQNPSASPSNAVQYMTFNTPIGVAEAMQCGREVFTDLHVGDASNEPSGRAFPSACKDADLSTQEKIVEFMLFDLSSCIQNDELPPEPPPIIR